MYNNNFAYVCTKYILEGSISQSVQFRVAVFRERSPHCYSCRHHSHPDQIRQTMVQSRCKIGTIRTGKRRDTGGCFPSSPSHTVTSPLFFSCSQRPILEKHYKFQS